MELLTRQEAATYLRLSLRKLDALSATGDVRRVKLGEGKRARVLFRKEDLETFVRANLSADRLDFTRKAVEIMRPRN